MIYISTVLNCNVTVVQICGSSESEETMLLCDGCDLGYHMACLSPPLDEVTAFGHFTHLTLTKENKT